jgi:hypothetical protein
VCVAFVYVPHVTGKLRTPVKVEQVVLSRSIVHHDGSYCVVQISIAMYGLMFTPFVTGFVKLLVRNTICFILTSFLNKT